MKTKLEHLVFILILTPLAPLAGFLAGWWAAFTFLPEKWIPTGAIGGLLLGVLADLLVTKRLVRQARRLGNIFWMAVFLFYTAGIFGFFMGVPVFNALLALPAGFVAASIMVDRQADPARMKQASKKTAWFTTGILFLVCTASAVIALLSKSTASDLQGMLGLGFEVTQGMIVALILVGGILLLAVNWGLTFASSHFIYRFIERKA